MDLVFLFGPPAVGKLTVARAPAARTGLKLFHNHLVLDAITAVFDFKSPAYLRLRFDYPRTTRTRCRIADSFLPTPRLA